MNLGNEIKGSIDKILMTNGEMASTLFGIKDNYCNGFYNEPWPSVIMQKFNKNSINIYDMFFFIKIWDGILKGELITCQHMLGHMPFKNNQVAENNNILNLLSNPFSAEFIPEDGGGANSDGYFSWDRDMCLQQEIRDPKDLEGNNSKISQIQIPPGYLQLEVGTTEAITTFFHVALRGGVARWPYNSESIYIIYNLNFNTHCFDSIDGAQTPEEYYREKYKMGLPGTIK